MGLVVVVAVERFCGGEKCRVKAQGRREGWRVRMGRASPLLRAQNRSTCRPMGSSD